MYHVEYRGVDSLSVWDSRREKYARWYDNRWHTSVCVTAEIAAQYLGCSVGFLEGVIATFYGLPNRYEIEANLKPVAQAPILTYFIEAVGFDSVKIGKSRCVLARFRGLCNVNATELRLLAVTTCEEKVLHRLFAADRLHGEWFTKTPALMAFVEACEKSLLMACDSAAIPDITPKPVYKHLRFKEGIPDAE